MVIEKLKLENYKMFKNQEITFSPGINIIFGQNGVGKTSILIALQKLLSNFFAQSNFDGREKRYKISLVDTDITIIPNEGKHYRFADTLESKVKCALNLTIGKESGEIITEKEKSGEKRNNEKTNNNFIAKEGKKVHEFLLKENNQNAPLIAYYSTSRLFSETKSSVNQSIYNARTAGYLECLNKKNIINQLTEFIFLRLGEQSSAIAKNVDKRFIELENIDKALNNSYELLTGISNSKFKLLFDGEYGIIVRLDNGLEVPLKFMSDGYRNFIYLVLDMVWRASTLNPHLTYEVLKKQTYGIVLIDEIDQHLHPRWQERIIYVIQELFPNVQFIISTHSPTVIGSLDARTGKDSISRITTNGDVKKYHRELFGRNFEFVLQVMEGNERVASVKEIDKELNELSIQEKFDIEQFKLKLSQLKELVPSDNELIDKHSFFLSYSTGKLNGKN